MPSTLHLPSQVATGQDNPRETATAAVQSRVAELLEQHPHFRYRPGTIEAEFYQGTLVLKGRLPSFYLKQLLQEALRQVEGVDTIDNRVDVVCCDGVSSVRK